MLTLTNSNLRIESGLQAGPRRKEISLQITWNLAGANEKWKLIKHKWCQMRWKVEERKACAQKSKANWDSQLRDSRAQLNEVDSAARTSIDDAANEQRLGAKYASIDSSSTIVEESL